MEFRAWILAGSEGKGLMETQGCEQSPQQRGFGDDTLRPFRVPIRPECNGEDGTRAGNGPAQCDAGRLHDLFKSPFRLRNRVVRARPDRNWSAGFNDDAPAQRAIVKFELG